MNIKKFSLRLFIATVLAVLMVSNSHVCRADLSHRYTDITGTSAHPGLDDSGGSYTASPRDFEVPRSLKDQIVEPSPGPAALNRYIDCPVSYSTGALGIQIPVYTLQVGDFSWPIALSYHTGGIKVDDMPGDVGLGWTLVGGGCVSRKINGLPDEFKGFLELDTSYPSKTTLDNFLKYLHNQVDTNRDRFYYNVPGYSGSFFVKGPYDIIMLPETGVDISIKHSGGQYVGFTITTPEGITYHYTGQEGTKYEYIPGMITSLYFSADYEATSAWYLSKIVLPEGRDEITFEYETGCEWQKNNTHKLNRTGYWWNTATKKVGIISQVSSGEAELNDKHLVTTLNQHVLKRITTRNAVAEFTHETERPHSAYNGTAKYITVVKIFTPDKSKCIREAAFEYSHLSDGRRTLGAVEITADNVLLDRRDFDYKSMPSTPSRDYFGYCNGYLRSVDNRSVLDEHGDISGFRTPNTYAEAGSISSMTDIMGCVTTFRYKPKVCGAGHGDVTYANGVAVSEITVDDPLTWRKRVRQCDYSDAVSNIDFKYVEKADYIAQSGTYTKVFGSQFPIGDVYSIGVTLTSSSRLQGFPVEDAVTYFGKARETVSGTGIETPIVTEYVYDTSRCAFPFSGGGRRIGEDGDWNYVGVEPYGSIAISYLLYSQRLSRGSFIEVVGDNVPLKQRITYRGTPGNLKMAERETRLYSIDSDTTYLTGFFCESPRRKFRYGNREKENYESINDFSYFNTYTSTYRRFCDSIITERFYPDGNTRRVVARMEYDLRPKTRDLYNLETKSFIALDPVGFPRFEGDSLQRALNGNLMATIIKCGSDSFANYRCYAANIRRGLLKTIATSGNMKNLPVMEKWISNGTDSVQKNYYYGRFTGRNGNKISRPVAVTLGKPGRRLMDAQYFTAYTADGHPARIARASGIAMNYTWDAHDDLLSSLVEGTGLKNKYEYQPLVGCTRSELSSGKIRQYTYTGGRLTSVFNKFGTPLVKYRYGLYADEALENDSVGNFVEESVRNSLDGWMVTRRHFDGFGDNYLTYGIGLGGDGETVVSGTKFDAVGRPVRVMVPVTGSHRELEGFPGVINSDNFDWIFDDLCPADSNATVLSYLPGNADSRAVITQSPGDDLANHPATANYVCNSSNPSRYYCPRYVYEDGVVKWLGAYPAGMLDVAEVVDADGHKSLVFTDFRGYRVLERRVIQESELLGKNLNLDTYYINDAWGNPRVVLQPMAFDNLPVKMQSGWSFPQDVIDSYAFVYEYDESMRVVSKKLPGCEPVRYCYDRCGQLAFSQDGNLRDEGRRMFYLYDTAGRPTLTGLCDAPATWAAYTDTAMISSRANHRAIDKTYYSAPVALGNPKMLNAWYYDTYINLPDHYYDLSVVRHGLLTISSSALMPPVGDQDRIVTSNYYDFDDRLCESTTDIAGGGTINTRTVYTISGQVDSVWTTTRLPGKAATVDRYKYRYDHADRLKSVTFYHVDGAPVVLAVNGYDALGRLVTAKLPGETVSYGYNVRNALTSISSPRFSQQLRYAAGAAAPCYNGNIAEAVTQGNKYAYIYDNANRLTSAKYTPSAGDADYSATYAYDRNSNITALTRKGLKDIFGNYGPVDDLTMLYDGNRLWRVSDHADEVLLENSGNLRNPEIFDPSETQFGYDANGNTVKDLSRNIEKMDYNPINLPLSARLEQGTDRLTGRKTNQSISYTYDASGIRHRVIHATQPLLGTRPMRIATADTTDYVGNYVIRNGQIDKIMTPYGYLQDGKFHTFLHDYQGNVAAVVVGDSVAQRNSYYPYGLPHYTGIVKKTSFSSSSMTANPYKYGGKEYDTFGGTDLYDFHARHHAPSTGRFMTVDPMAEKYPGISPYIYCAGNPVLFIDDDGKETKLYATKLPGAISLLDPATHTFILVSQANGDYKYYSYGSSHGGKFHGIPGAIGGQLKRMFYNQDISVIEHPAENEDKIKNVITIDPPEGMTSEEFDNKVIEVAESFGNHKSIKYFLWPIMPDRGNCNSSSFTILRKAGVSNENLKMIESQIPGIHWGTRSEKAWTKDEQDDAALEGAILRPNPIMDKLLEIIYAILNSK